MYSERLTYERLSSAALDEFHRLVQDEHVRQYMMDGQLMTREWSDERIRASDDLFARRGVGLWLAREGSSGALVGFCGFLEIPAMHPEPQLVYALVERFTGQGYATEMARAAIAAARRHPGFERIVAGVDAANAASVRVLQKLGFRTIGVQPGAFGDALLLELDSRPVRTL